MRIVLEKFDKRLVSLRYKPFMLFRYSSCCPTILYCTVGYCITALYYSVYVIQSSYSVSKYM